MSDVRGSDPRVPVEERLFSLVLALLSTDTGLTKQDILSSVQGYSQRYRQGGDNASLERQFERDKDDIRELGVPLETLDSPEAAGNNQLLRYRIPRGDYELPGDVRFTAEETALLGLAAMVWREGAMSGQSRRALMKLRGVGSAPSVPLLGYQPRLRLRDPAYEPLLDALERGTIARFAYLKPGEERARDREVIPLALVQYQGRWHLSAEETAGGVRKNFLLRRIVGAVTTGGPAPARAGDHAAEALRGLAEIWDAHQAVVEAVPESDAARRLGNRRGAEPLADGRLALHYVDLAILADELTAFGPEVLVISPPELCAAVIERLERIGAEHA